MYTNFSQTGSSLPRFHSQPQRRSWTSSLVSPPPPSTTNSLRSAHVSLRSPTNSALLRNSMIIEPMPVAVDHIMSNELTSDDIKIGSRNASTDAIMETKLSSNILPIFIMESLSLICLASLAYFLRFTDSFGVLVRGFFCDDTSISYPFEPFGNSSAPVMTNINDGLFYAIIIGLPILMIIICEMIGAIFISHYTLKKKRVIAANSGCITCRIHLILRRVLRFTGGFLYGLLITSVITDALKLISGRLRPYFLHVCQSIIEICGSVRSKNDNSSPLVSFSHTWIDPNQYNDQTLCDNNNTSALRLARMSFPSWTASVTVYVAAFAIIYINSVIRFRCGHIIRLWLSALTLISMLITITGRVTAHHNHVDDIIMSALIAVCFSTYISVIHLNRFRDKQNSFDEIDSSATNTDEEEDAWFWKYFHIPRVNLLRRSARYFRKRDANEQINIDSSNGSSYVNPAFEHKDFQNKQTLNIDRRTAYQDSYSRH